jgi:hypothetical protein
MKKLILLFTLTLTMLVACTKWEETNMQVQTITNVTLVDSTKTYQSFYTNNYGDNIPIIVNVNMIDSSKTLNTSYFTMGGVAIPITIYVTNEGDTTGVILNNTVPITINQAPITLNMGGFEFNMQYIDSSRHDVLLNIAGSNTTNNVLLQNTVEGDSIVNNNTNTNNNVLSSITTVEGDSIFLNNNLINQVTCPYTVNTCIIGNCHVHHPWRFHHYCWGGN